MGSKPREGASREAIALMNAVTTFMRAYKSRMKTILADVSSHESTPSRVMLVVVLRNYGSLPMGGLAMHVGLPKSNITALVDDLEAEGVLRRRRDETDRRITHVELTAKGRALVAREYDAYEQQVAAIFDTLPADERAPMLSGLERMTRRLREDDGEKPESPTVRMASAAVPKTRAKGRLRVG